MNSLLLIDDKPAVLDELEKHLRELLPVDEAEIRTWAPKNDENDPLAEFDQLVDKKGTVLVVTDYDLTGNGRTGLFGASIVAWCQKSAIPVGDYSREIKTELPKEPNLFELRVPKNTEQAARFIAAVFRGFAYIRGRLLVHPQLMTEKRSPAAVIAELLGCPDLQSQFALYGVRLGATSAALIEHIVKKAPDNVEPTDEEKRALLAYIVGHLLLNSVLRFPGPILSEDSLTAYVGVSLSEAADLRAPFSSALYTGPFADLGTYYWLSKVDEILRPMLDTVDSNEGQETERTHGELNREALERQLGRVFARHRCDRCNGRNGGFWCPFTKRAVCLQEDCSIGANSWVPQGARLCRIERGFYDEWAPILGI